MKFTSLFKKAGFTTMALAATFGLVGCGNQTETQGEVEVVTSISEPVEIEFWHNLTGAFSDSMAEIVENFNSTIGAEKGIHVNATYQGSYDDLKAKITASIKANNSPNVVQGTVNNIMELAQSGFIQELDPYIYHDEIGIKDYEDVYQGYRDEMSSYFETGETLSLPFAKSTDLLFYNKTFFEENNLTPPTTWEETVEVSKKIYELTGKPGLSIDNLPNYLITYLFQAGAEYTNQNGELLFNNETSLKAIEMLKTGMEEGYFRIAGEDKYSSGPFLAENVYMYIGTTAGEGFLNRDNFDWDTTFVPQVDVENPVGIQQGANIAILNQGATSEEVYASYEFIKYMISTETNTKWSMDTGYLPVRESVFNSDEYQEYLANSQGNVKLNGVKAVENGFIEAIFQTDSYSSAMVRNEVGTMLESILLDGQDPVEMLDYYANTRIK